MKAQTFFNKFTKKKEQLMILLPSLDHTAFVLLVRTGLVLGCEEVILGHRAKEHLADALPVLDLVRGKQILQVATARVPE